MKRQQTLFENVRMTLDESIELTAQSLSAYSGQYNHWAIAYSGGKDSSALLTITLTLIEQGRIPKPKSLTVLYSDTRQELPPLQIGAVETLKTVKNMGYNASIVLPEIDKRFFVYMLGRGVPPPNNNTLRWCTSQIKVIPMINALNDLRIKHGEKFLMLTGVRIGESAARDSRIALSCSKNGAECGQGWFQQSTPDSVADTLAPILHWRVCHVWDWLSFNAHKSFPSVSFVAQVYGGEEAEEINARTGCVGCPLATKDTALDHILKIPEWEYLRPLKRLRPLYEELRKFSNRKQKNAECNSDGNLSANPCRKGPLTLEARENALEQILDIQSNINSQAIIQHRPEVWLIDGVEESRIRELISKRTYPNKWSDADPDATQPIPQTFNNGDRQDLLTGFLHSFF
jgi:DNA sulfur modification protein DndC